MIMRKRSASQTACSVPDRARAGQITKEEM